MGDQCVLSIVGYRCFKKSLICDTVAGCDRDCITHFLLQLLFLWDPPRGYREQGNNVIYFRVTGEHMSKNERNRGTKVIFGSREHRKIRFWFWGTKENAEIFQGNKGTGTPTSRPEMASLIAATISNEPGHSISWKNACAPSEVSSAYAYIQSCQFLQGTLWVAKDPKRLQVDSVDWSACAPVFTDDCWKQSFL